MCIQYFASQLLGASSQIPLTCLAILVIIHRKLLCEYIYTVLAEAIEDIDSPTTFFGLLFVNAKDGCA